MFSNTEWNENEELEKREEIKVNNKLGIIARKQSKNCGAFASFYLEIRKTFSKKSSWNVT
jgi:hypothetical protein